MDILSISDSKAPACLPDWLIAYTILLHLKSCHPHLFTHSAKYLDPNQTTPLRRDHYSQTESTVPYEETPFLLICVLSFYSLRRVR